MFINKGRIVGLLGLVYQDLLESFSSPTTPFLPPTPSPPPPPFSFFCSPAFSFSSFSWLYLPVANRRFVSFLFRRWLWKGTWRYFISLYVWEFFFLTFFYLFINFLVWNRNLWNKATVAEVWSKEENAKRDCWMDRPTDRPTDRLMDRLDRSDSQEREGLSHYFSIILFPKIWIITL